jgi:hypothetical protein
MQVKCPCGNEMLNMGGDSRVALILSKTCLEASQSNNRLFFGSFFSPEKKERS